MKNKDLNGYNMGPLKEKAALFTFNTHTPKIYIGSLTCVSERERVSKTVEAFPRAQPSR